MALAAVHGSALRVAEDAKLKFVRGSQKCKGRRMALPPSVGWHDHEQNHQASNKTSRNANLNHEQNHEQQR